MSPSPYEARYQRDRAGPRDSDVLETVRGPAWRRGAASAIALLTAIVLATPWVVSAAGPTADLLDPLPRPAERAPQGRNWVIAQTIVLVDPTLVDLRPTFDEVAGTGALEPFGYVEVDGGMIEIDPTWVERYIVAAEVPLLGQVRCHVEMMAPLAAVLREMADLGLGDLVDPEDFGGCWVPRHIDWDPTMPLSMHAWGLALDLGVSQNPLGAEPTLDPRIVEVFEAKGFEWGGRWSRPDGMHFQLRVRS